MKKLFFIFLTQVTFAQADFTKIYHPIINEAELAIVDDNHAEALTLYKEAFSLVEKPFAKDYYNAAICAVFTNRLSTAFEFLEKIVEKGYPADSLRKDVFFKSVADTCKRWDAFEKQARLIKPNINHELKDTLQKIFESSFKEIKVKISNELREFYKKGNYKLPPDSLLFVEGMPTEIRNNLATTYEIRRFQTKNWHFQQLKKTLNLINIYGFPDENLIGVSNHDVISVFSKGLFSSKTTYAKYHFSSHLVADIFRNSSIEDTKDSTEIRKEIRKLVYDAVREGKLLPRDARDVLEERIAENQPYHLDDISVFQLKLEDNLTCEKDFPKEKLEKWFWRKSNSPNFSTQEINEKRYNLGLSNLENTYRKTFFKATYPDTPFLLTASNYRREILYVASCETAQKTINEAVELK